MTAERAVVERDEHGRIVAVVKPGGDALAAEVSRLQSELIDVRAQLAETRGALSREGERAQAEHARGLVEGSGRAERELRGEWERAVPKLTQAVVAAAERGRREGYTQGIRDAVAVVRHHGVRQRAVTVEGLMREIGATGEVE